MGTHQAQGLELELNLWATPHCPPHGSRCAMGSPEPSWGPGSAKAVLWAIFYSCLLTVPTSSALTSKSGHKGDTTVFPSGRDRKAVRFLSSLISLPRVSARIYLSEFFPGILAVTGGQLCEAGLDSAWLELDPTSPLLRDQVYGRK